MKRRSVIATAGHDEQPHPSGKGVGCQNCPAVRLKDQPWTHPCPAVDRHATPLVVPVQPVHVVTKGRYFGKTKQGG